MFELMIIACVCWYWKADMELVAEEIFFVKIVKIVLFDLKYTNVVTVISKTG